MSFLYRIFTKIWVQGFGLPDCLWLVVWKSWPRQLEGKRRYPFSLDIFLEVRIHQLEKGSILHWKTWLVIVFSTFKYCRSNATIRLVFVYLQLVSAWLDDHFPKCEFGWRSPSRVCVLSRGRPLPLLPNQDSGSERMVYPEGRYVDHGYDELLVGLCQ